MIKLTYPRFVLLLALVGAVVFMIQKLRGKTDKPWF
jgi:hypothetical protein